MKNVNVGNDLNKMSMATEEKDDDDMFLDSLSEGLKIAAAALISPKKNKESRSVFDLIPASNSPISLTIDSILK